MTRKIKLHGCIELEVPEGMTDYAAYQELEQAFEHINALEAGGFEAGNSDAYRISDFYLGKKVSEKEGVQRTAHFAEWLLEVGD